MHDQTLLHADEAELTHKRHRRHLKRRAIWITVVTLLVAWVVLFCIALGQAIAKTFEGRDALLQAQAYVEDLQFTEAKNELSAAKSAFADANNGLIFVKTLAGIPYVRDRVDEISRLLDSGIDIVDSLNSLLSIAQDLIQLSGLSDDYFLSLEQHLSPSISFDELPTETKRVLLKRLSASADDLELLATRIHVSRQELALIRSNFAFESVFGFLDRVAVQLTQAESQLQTLSTLARILPEFGGLEQEKTHLILLLNNDELRPGGGFIGTYGVLQMQDGEIRSLKTKDVYALDRFSEGVVQTPAYAPMQAYNATPVLYLRDANWSPDFAVSSLSVMNAFLQESANVPEAERANVPTAQRVDGVIGMNPQVISGLLKITGPITVSGESFNADNVAEEIEYQVERGFEENGVPYAQRKEILSDLMTELRARILALPIAQWKDVFAVAEEGFEEKYLFLYSANSATEDVISRVGWGGRVEQKTADIQLVVDANLASLKTDPEVKRSINYQIAKNSTGQYIGRTTITYRHEGSFNWRTSRYRTYTRLYVPKGTRFIRANGTLLNDKTKNVNLAPGQVDVFEDLNMTAFGAFTAIEPGQVKELTFDYELAPSVVEAINRGAYNLSVLKQNGARDSALTLTLDFGKNVANAVPQEERKDWGNNRYELTTQLEGNRTFTVTLQ